ncbi:MAG: hypothetical protein ABJZ55_08755 [Fuerstiella sp.]
MWKLVAGTGLALVTLATAMADNATEKPDVTVEFCGRIRHGVMVIGGECTGTTIAVNRMTWEIQLTSDAQQKFAQQHHKKSVVVTGTLKKVVGIEMKDRWIIDAKKLVPQDPEKHKLGVRMIIVGKLQPTSSKDTPAAFMTIDSGGQVWSIDLSANPKLKATASSLVGESVWVMGSLKQPAEQNLTQEKSGVPPILYVSSLKKQTSDSLNRDRNQ